MSSRLRLKMNSAMLTSSEAPLAKEGTEKKDAPRYSAGI